MSASESYSDDFLSSAESDFNEVEEYDIEVEEFQSQTEVSDPKSTFYWFLGANVAIATLVCCRTPTKLRAAKK